MESSLGQQVTKIRFLARAISISRCRAGRFVSGCKASRGLSLRVAVNTALCPDCERCAGLLILKVRLLLVPNFARSANFLRRNQGFVTQRKNRVGTQSLAISNCF